MASPALRRFSTPSTHLADLGQADRGAVAVSDDQGLVLVRRRGLVVVVDLVMAVADLDGALRAVGVGGSERRPHVLEPDLVLVERVRVELDPHRRQGAAADHHFADAVDLRQLLRQHGRGGVVELASSHGVGGQRQDQDRRIGRIDLLVSRIGPQARRQVGARGVNRRLDVARRAVDVAVEAELEVDAHRADRARRRHLGDVGDLPEMALKRRRDRRGDDFRASAGQLRLHRDGGKIDLWKRRHRKLEERDGARGRDPEREQDSRDRPSDERGRDAHSAGLPCSASRTAPSMLK